MRSRTKNRTPKYSSPMGQRNLSPARSGSRPVSPQYPQPRRPSSHSIRSIPMTDPDYDGSTTDSSSQSLRSVPMTDPGYDDLTPHASSSVLPSMSTASPSAVSLSRASSVISTGTKTSITTLPQEPPSNSTYNGPIDVVLGQRNFRITARPGSILSISSFDHPSSASIPSLPAPPYSENALPEASASTSTLTSYAEARHSIDAPPYASFSNPLDAPFSLPPNPAPEDLTLSTPTPQRTFPFSISTPSNQPQPPPQEESHSRTPSPPSPPPSPLSSSENALSRHYTRVVTLIDSNHRSELSRLETHYASAISQTRHDIDAAYRAELASRTATWESSLSSLQSQLSALEGELAAARDETEVLQAKGEDVLREVREKLEGEREAAVQRARNETEDLWEGRWRDRMRLAAEEVGAAFEERVRVGRVWEGVVSERWGAEQARGVGEEVGRRLKGQVRKRGGGSGSEAREGKRESEKDGSGEQAKELMGTD